MIFSSSDNIIQTQPLLNSISSLLQEVKFLRDKLIQQQKSKRHTQHILVLCLTEKYEEQQQTYMYLKYTHTPHYHNLHPCFTFHICDNSNSPFPDMCLALLMVISENAMHLKDLVCLRNLVFQLQKPEKKKSHMSLKNTEL